MLQQNDYALVIGVDEYPNYRSLNGPVKDATNFANWLKDPNVGGGLPSENCYLLLNPDSPMGTIAISLNLIANQVELARTSGQSPRRFYLYFSGHGQSPRIDEINLCLKWWSSTRLSRLALSARDCWSEMVNCSGFSEVAVFLDCCRVWVASAGGYPPGMNCPIPVQPASGTRLFQAFSSEFLHKSYEGEEVSAGAEENPVYSGLFTRTLLNALNGAAADPTGGVRQEALKLYLETEVPRLAIKEKNVIQQPVIDANLLTGTVFGNAKLPEIGNCTIRFKTVRQRPVILVSPDNDEITCPDNTRNWELRLSKGLHQLVDQSRAGDTLTFRFQPKEEKSYVDF